MDGISSLFDGSSCWEKRPNSIYTRKYYQSSLAKDDAFKRRLSS